MANFRSIYYIVQIIIMFIIHLSSGLYEDQVGKFDWKRSFIGRVKYAKFDVKRLIVATEENVIASLNIKNGNIIWRQLLEDSRTQEVKYLHLGKDVITISGGLNNWYIRSWDISNGALLSEWVLLTENTVRSEFLIMENIIVHIALTPGSYLELTKHTLQNGEIINKTQKIPTPWIINPSNCVCAKNYFVCLSKSDITETLLYIDVLSEESKIYSKHIKDLLGEVSGNIEILDFESDVPSILLLHNNVARLVTVNEEHIDMKPFILMPNAITVSQDDLLSIYQLEASSNPDKIIKVKVKNHLTGNDEFEIDLNYPIGLGAPIILTGQSKGATTDLLLSTTDDALLLVQLPEGKILWTREEALSNIVAVEFIELPVSELDASIEKEFKTSSSNILTMLTHRLSTQATQLSNLIFGSQLSANHGLVRDNFGLHKIIIAATKAGKLFALDTLSGSIVWSYRLPNIKSFEIMNNKKVLLFVQRTARYAPLPAQCTLLVEDAITGNGILFQFDPISGYSQRGIERLNYKIAQAILLPFEDDHNLKPIVVISSSYEVYVYPDCEKSLVYQQRSRIYVTLVDIPKGTLKGFTLLQSTKDNLKLTPNWNINLYPSKLVGVATKPPNERVHSQGRVLPDRSVYYKYVNPNLIAIATVSEDPVHKHVLSIYLVDGVTGLILYSVSHKRAKGPVHLVHSENWLVYSYFNERFRRMEMVAAELYEGYMQSNSTVFSSYAVSLLPLIQTQSYILPATLVKMEVTLTERGITNKFLLLGLSNGAVIEIPWLLLQPRFNDIPCGPEESCIPYMPEIPLPPEACLNYNQTIWQIHGIEVAPARLESTSHVLVHGLDIFYTRVAPSKTFDLLKEDFDHLMIILVLSGLIVASYVTKYLASKKALRQLWK